MLDERVISVYLSFVLVALVEKLSSHELSTVIVVGFVYFLLRQLFYYMGSLETVAILARVPYRRGDTELMCNVALAVITCLAVFVTKFLHSPIHFLIFFSMGTGLNIWVISLIKDAYHSQAVGSSTVGEQISYWVKLNFAEIATSVAGLLVMLWKRAPAPPDFVNTITFERNVFCFTVGALFLIFIFDLVHQMGLQKRAQQPAAQAADSKESAAATTA